MRLKRDSLVFLSGGTSTTAAAVIADNVIVRGDGGARGVQGSNVSITDTGHILCIDGTAAAPSISFASDTDTGFYRVGADAIGIAGGGSAIGSLAANGTGLRVNGSSSSFIDITGQININAGGTNQSITLTPSGTGKIQGGTTTSTSTATPLVISAGGTYFNSDTITSAAVKIRSYDDGAGNVSGFLSSPGRSGVWASSGTHLDFVRNGTLMGRFAATTGNLLLGGLTTDGTGVLQFPAATTTAGGIGFGTDLFLHRSAAGILNQDVGAGSPIFVQITSGAQPVYIRQINSVGSYFLGAQVGASSLIGSGGIANSYVMVSPAATSIQLAPAGTAALTLDSSQNGLAAGVWAFKGAAVSTSTAVNLPAATTALSSLRVAHGTAPTSPVDGDIWTTTAGLYVRINGATVGPLS